MMMHTYRIPRNDWTIFFDAFSRKYEGSGVELEVRGPEIGDQMEEHGLFLTGVVAEVADHGDKIEIMMGGKPDRHLTHVISRPTYVGVDDAVEGSNGVLQINSADGTTAVLQFD